MCGLLFTDNAKITKQNFQNALLLMKHRGPDVPDSCISHKKYKLGHNRLKIIDLDDRSNQPIYSKDKRYIMIYNGEVYNYQELANRFEIEQNTTGDTEVIIELYAKLGPGMLKHLNGMFAIVIVDTLTDDVFIARDPLGIKPLYFSDKNDNIIISSEIAAILDLSDTAKIDEIGIRQYLKLRTFFNGHTLYSDIKMFPAGSYMQNKKIYSYWSFPQIKQEAPSNEELDSLIRTSVEMRCISDVPVGSFLSGGIDSTIIALLAAKPYTWTVGFKNFNEFEWGRIAAEKINSIHHEVLIDEEEFVSLAKYMISKRRECLSVPNEVLIYKMAKNVKFKNTVILSGEGADELFYGYDRIFTWAKNNNWNLQEFDRLYSYGSHRDDEIIDYVISPFRKYGDNLSIISAFFQIAHLHGLLRRLDNSTMLCSIEARVPFVDLRIVERMAGVPFEFKIKNKIIKKPLKELYRKNIPEEIILRKKIGFPVPLENIIFDVKSDRNITPMDEWLHFNIKELKLNYSLLEVI